MSADENQKKHNARKNHELKNRLLARDGVKCQLSGEPLNSYDNMEIDHIIPLSAGGTDVFENLRLVNKHFNEHLSNKDIQRIDALTKDLLKRQEELTTREQENFQREQDYRNQIERQKQELDHLRDNIQREGELRKLKFDQELKVHLAMLQEREKEAEKLKQEYHKALVQNEIDLKNKVDELEKEKERYREESRHQIEARSNSYVNEAITALDTSAKSFHSKGARWSVAGLLSLAGGVGTGIFFGIAGMTALENSEKISWPVVSFLAFKGIIVIGLFIALAKYCFTYSQSFTHEAIKNSERKHAINFGKFYLETYGAEAEWGQVKEAFEHWNINSSSAFSGNDADKFDPKIFDKAMEIAESVQKFGRQNKEESKS